MADAVLPGLVQRIQGGDRAALADFVMQNAPMIRRRIAGKLGTQMRRLYDSQEILSTVLRRLDRHLAQRELRAATEDQLWALIMATARTSIIDKARIVERLRRSDSEDVAIARAFAQAVPAPDDSMSDDVDDTVMARCFDALESDDDRKLMWFWLTGVELRSCCEMVGVSYETGRKRWQRIRARLAEVMERASA